jgi:hypothetical protein
MFVLGLLVLAAAAVAAVELVLANRGAVDFHMWNQTWHLDVFWIAVIGAVIVTAAWIAVGLMQIAFAHARSVRRANRQLVAENRMLSERVASTDTVEPMPVETTRVVDRSSAEDGYVEGDGGDGGQHQGFFSRHAMSGRGHRP